MVEAGHSSELKIKASEVQIKASEVQIQANVADLLSKFRTAQEAGNAADAKQIAEELLQKHHAPYLDLTAFHELDEAATASQQEVATQDATPQATDDEQGQPNEQVDTPTQETDETALSVHIPELENLDVAFDDPETVATISAAHQQATQIVEGVVQGTIKTKGTATARWRKQLEPALQLLAAKHTRLVSSNDSEQARRVWDQRTRFVKVKLLIDAYFDAQKAAVKQEKEASAAVDESPKQEETPEQTERSQEAQEIIGEILTCQTVDELRIYMRGARRSIRNLSQNEQDDIARIQSERQKELSAAAKVETQTPGKNAPEPTAAEPDDKPPEKEIIQDEEMEHPLGHIAQYKEVQVLYDVITRIEERGVENLTLDEVAEYLRAIREGRAAIDTFVLGDGGDLQGVQGRVRIEHAITEQVLTPAEKISEQLNQRSRELLQADDAQIWQQLRAIIALNTAIIPNERFDGVITTLEKVIASLADERTKMLDEVNGDEQHPKIEFFDKQVQQVKAKLEDVEAKKEVAERENVVELTPSQKKIKASVENFLTQRQIELRSARPEFEDIAKYLEVIHKGILNIVIISVWNEHLDNSDEPRTVSYKKSPMFGAKKEVALLGQTLIYDRSTDQNIFSLESFLDQFHLYVSDDERQQVKEFCERMKEFIREVSIWHNRAAVRRKHEDATGPNGAYTALTELYNQSNLSPHLKPFFVREENGVQLLETEKCFSEALEFSMGVWSVLSLKERELQRLAPFIDPKIKDTYLETYQVGGSRKFRVKKEYRVLPRYVSTDTERLKMIEQMLEDLKRMGLSETEAMLAYHIGESYRTGAGLEAFMDVSYRGGKKNEDKSNVSVQAQEGEPKAANIGLYVESAWGNPTRPDFVLPFKDYMVHGYIPFSRAAQFSHKLRDQGGQLIPISEVPDGRASLAELLSVKGGIQAVDWDTGSTNPDKTVQQAATQAVNFLWPSAAVKNASTPQHSFFIDIQNIPMNTTELLDREDEIVPLRYQFGFQGNWMKRSSALVSKLSFRANPSEYEQYGFHSESTPISGERNQRIRALYKDSRDYWVNAFTADISQYQGDFLRMMMFSFSRDDTESGYVNDKIGQQFQEAIIDLQQRTTVRNDGSVSLRNKNVREQEEYGFKNSSEKFKKWLTGYLTYDLLMRSVFYLLKPDTRQVQELLTNGQLDPEKIAHAYNSVEYTNYEDFVIKTIGSARLINVAQLGYVINQAMLLEDLFPEKEELLKAGYRLWNDNPHAPNGYMYDHQDLLRLAKEHNLGNGYEYGVQKDKSGRRFMQLQRTGNKPTYQWLADRVTLLRYLFNKSELHLSH